MNEHLLMDTLDPVDFEKRSLLNKCVCLTVVYHPNIDRIGERVIVFKDQNPSQVGLSRLTPIFHKEDHAKSGPLASLCLSRRPLWLSPAPSDGVALYNEPKGSEVIVNGTQLKSRRELDRNEIKTGVVLELARRVVMLLHYVKKIEPSTSSMGFIGHSETIEQLRASILRIANQNTPVLIRGETGVGKELVARAIHTSSQRAVNPFVCINMAAISPSIASSELFGHSKGAFTGAVCKHNGYFQQAHTGTLFLDEIGTTTLQVQAMLLRVLETKEIHPVGAQHGKPVDVRIITATDDNLESAIETNLFRSSLYHRLSNFVITVPPLRDRRDDIGRLLIAILRNELDAVGESYRLKPPEESSAPWLPTSLISRLVRHRWPGNIRELQNVVRQIVIASRDPHIDLAGSINHLINSEESTSGTATVKTLITEKKPRHNPSKINERMLIEALRSNKWHIGSTASQLMISRASLYLLIERSANIRKAKDITREELEKYISKHGRDLATIASHLEVSERGLKLRMKELNLP